MEIGSSAKNTNAKIFFLIYDAGDKEKSNDGYIRWNVSHENFPKLKNECVFPSFLSVRKFFE